MSINHLGNRLQLAVSQSDNYNKCSKQRQLTGREMKKGLLVWASKQRTRNGTTTTTTEDEEEEEEHTMRKEVTNYKWNDYLMALTFIAVEQKENSCNDGSLRYRIDREMGSSNCKQREAQSSMCRWQALAAGSLGCDIYSMIEKRPLFIRRAVAAGVSSAQTHIDQTIPPLL